tara:strand:- start:119 stop:529 length:411 start_codon:yes stop_codon:yes gene_type:complete
MLNILKKRQDLTAPDIVIEQLKEQYIILQKIYENRKALLQNGSDLTKDLKDALTQTYPIAIKKRNNKKRARMTPAIVSYHFNTCVLQHFLVMMSKEDSTNTIKLELVHNTNNILKRTDDVNRIIKNAFDENAPFKH